MGSPGGTGSMNCALHTFLDGVTVVDLSHYLAGPYASLTLADMGARVIKVEPPGGDPMRTLGPRDQQGNGAFHEALNAGKASITLDLKNPVDRARLLDQVDTADVFIEGFRPGVSERLGFDYATLSARRPSLVYCSLSGYGRHGPLMTRGGHDGNFLAERGVAHRNGDEAPVYYDPPIADMAGALYATSAILGALLGRHKTGRGVHIDLALADTVMPLQLTQLAGWDATGVVPTRGSTYLNGGTACYHIYATRDGRHVMLGAIEEKFWRRFCETAGHIEWIDRQSEPSAQTNLIAALAGYFASLNVDELLERFGTVDCCLSLVSDLAEAVASPQVTARGLVVKAHGALQTLFPAFIDGMAPRPRPPLTQATHGDAP